MSRSPSSQEHDAVDLCTKEELVNFQHVSLLYPPGSDVAIHYTLGKRVSDTPLDWIGIFPSDWRDICHPLTFQWAPVHPPDQAKPRRRVAIFPARLMQPLEHECNTYQFLYVTKDKQVLGVSQAFAVKHPEGVWDMDPELYNFTSGDSHSGAQDASSGQSESPVLLSSDEDWEFPNQSCTTRRGSSSTSQLSDIIILSTSPSQEITIHALKDEHILLIEHETGDNKGDSNTFSSGQDWGQFHSPSCDSTQEKIIPGVDQDGPSNEAEKKTKNGEMKNLTKQAEARPGNPGKWPANSVAENVIKFDLAGLEAGRRKQTAPSKLEPSVPRVSSSHGENTDWQEALNVNSLGSLSIYNQLKIVEVDRDSDDDFDEADKERLWATNSGSGNLGTNKIEVLEESSCVNGISEAFNRHEDSGQHEMAVSGKNDVKTKKQKRKKTKRRQDSEEIQCPVVHKETLTVSQATAHSNISHGKNQTKSNEISMELFDHLNSQGKEHKLEKETWKVSEKRGQNGSESKSSSENGKETKLISPNAHVYDVDLSLAEKREVEKKARQLERKNRRRSLPVFKDDTGGRTEWKGPPICTTDTGGKVDASDVKAVTAVDEEMRAIRKKYLQASKLKSKKRKKVLMKSESESRYNMAFLFKEFLVSEPQQTESGEVSAPDVEEPIASLALEDTSDEGFPALPSAHKGEGRDVNSQLMSSAGSENLSRQKTVETADTTGDLGRESRSSDDGSDLELPKDMTLCSKDVQYVSPYLLDIMAALPTAGKYPGQPLVDMRQGPLPFVSKGSLPTFKAKYKTKYSKRLELKRMKLHRKSLYLNSGIVERVKRELSKCVEKEPLAKSRLTQSLGGSNLPVEVAHTDTPVETAPASQKSLLDQPPTAAPVWLEDMFSMLCSAPHNGSVQDDGAVVPDMTSSAEKDVVTPIPSGEGPERVTPIAKKHPLSYASVVKKSSEAQSNKKDCIQTDTGISIIIETPPEDSDNQEMLERWSEPYPSCEKSGTSCQMETSRPDLAECQTGSQADASLESSQWNAETSDNQTVSNHEELEDVENVLTQLSSATTQVKARESEESSPSLGWPLPKLVNIPSSFGSWFPENLVPEAFKIVETTSCFEQTENWIHHRPVSKTPSNKAFTSSQSPPKRPKMVVKEAIKSSVDCDIKPGSCQAEQLAVLDLALSTSLVENRNLKDRLDGMTKQLEALLSQFEEAHDHQGQPQESRPAFESGLQNRGRLEEERQRRVAKCRWAGEVKSLVRSSVAIFQLNSTLKEKQGEIASLENQVNTLKEALDVETKRASKAAMKCLKLKIKLKAVKVRLRSYEEPERSERSDRSEGTGADTGVNVKSKQRSELDTVHQHDEYEPPRKKRRMEGKVTPEENDIPKQDMEGPTREVHQEKRQKANTRDSAGTGLSKNTEELTAPNPASTVKSTLELHPATNSSSFCSLSPRLSPLDLDNIDYLSRFRSPLYPGTTSELSCPYLSSAFVDNCSSPPTSYMPPLGPYLTVYPSSITSSQPEFWRQSSPRSSNGHPSCDPPLRHRTSPPHLPLPSPIQNSPSAAAIRCPVFHYSRQGNVTASHPLFTSPPTQGGSSHCHFRRSHHRSMPPHLPLPPPMHLQVPCSNSRESSKHNSQSPPRDERNTCRSPSRQRNTHQSRASYSRTDSPQRSEVVRNTSLSTQHGNAHSHHCMNPCPNSCLHPSTHHGMFTQSIQTEPSTTQIHHSHLCWSSKPLSESRGSHALFTALDSHTFPSSYCPVVGDGSKAKAYVAPFQTAWDSVTDTQDPHSSTLMAFASSAALCPQFGNANPSESISKRGFDSAEGKPERTSDIWQHSDSEQQVGDMSWQGLAKTSLYHCAPTALDHCAESSPDSNFQSTFLRQLVRDETNTQKHKQQHKDNDQSQPGYLEPQSSHTYSPQLDMHCAPVSPPPGSLSDVYFSKPSFYQPTAAQSPTKIGTSCRPFQIDIKLPNQGNLPSEHEHFETDQQRMLPTAHNDYRHLYQDSVSPLTVTSSCSHRPAVHLPTHQPTHSPAYPPVHPPAHPQAYPPIHTSCSSQPAKQTATTFLNSSSVVELSSHGLIRGGSKPGTCFTCGSSFECTVDKRLIEASIASHQKEPVL